MALNSLVTGRSVMTAVHTQAKGERLWTGGSKSVGLKQRRRPSGGGTTTSQLHVPRHDMDGSALQGKLVSW